jgi:cardiolipin synthase
LVGHWFVEFRSPQHFFNDEVDVVVLGSDTGQDLETMFRDDQNAATPIAIGAWRSRPLPDRLKELYAVAWEMWL